MGLGVAVADRSGVGPGNGRPPLASPANGCMDSWPEEPAPGRKIADRLPMPPNRLARRSLGWGDSSDDDGAGPSACAMGLALVIAVY